MSAAPPPPQRMPVPLQMDVRTVSLDGHTLVSITVSTPVGSNTYFIEPASAEELGTNLIRIAKQTPAGGLLVPTPVVPRDLRGPK